MKDHRLRDLERLAATRDAAECGETRLLEEVNRIAETLGIEHLQHLTIDGITVVIAAHLRAKRASARAKFERSNCHENE